MLCGCVRMQRDLLFIYDKDAVVLGGDAWHWMLTGHLSLIVTAGKDRQAEKKKKGKHWITATTVETRGMECWSQGDTVHAKLHYMQNARSHYKHTHWHPGLVCDTELQHNVLFDVKHTVPSKIKESTDCTRQKSIKQTIFFKNTICSPVHSRQCESVRETMVDQRWTDTPVDLSLCLALPHCPLIMFSLAFHLYLYIYIYFIFPLYFCLSVLALFLFFFHSVDLSKYKVLNMHKYSEIKIKTFFSF